MKTIFRYVLTGAWLLALHSCEVKTEPMTPPAMDAVVVSDISVGAAVLSCGISNSGNQDILEHGFVYSESNAAPTVADSRTTNGAIDRVTPTPIPFSDRLEGLKINTTYNVRPYTTIASGPVYGAAITFRTLNIIQPGIKTDGSGSVTVNSAKLQGTVTSKGTNAVSEYGVCWSATNASPTTADSKAFKTGDVSSVPLGYSVDAGNLNPNTTYNFRAYVISGGVTSYGTVLTFKTVTVVQPQISTDAATSVGINSARLAGTLKAAGSYPVTEYGICWSTGANPTTANSKATVSGSVSNFPSSFALDAGGLEMSTTYNFRAYVMAGGVTTYGANLTFRTTDMVHPGVSTGGANAVTIISARLDGTLTSGGSYAISEYGVCWSVGANPTTGNTKSQRFGNVTSFPTGFTVDAGGLTPNTLYNYRAYVVANGVTIYGANQTFRTPPVVNASVTTTGGVNLGGAVFRFSGRIDNAGSYGITEYGIVYSTSTGTPTTANNKIARNNPGAIPFSYSVDQAGITPGTIHFFRAYAISGGVTVYGSVMTLSTGKD